MSTPIHFLKTKDPYGCFSNFSRHPVMLWGKVWLTSEAAYQASKYFPTNSEAFEAIHQAATPWDAATIGRSSERMVPFWESYERAHLERVLSPIDATHVIGLSVDDGRNHTPVIERYKDAVMYRVLWLKANQHKFIRQTLLDTGERTIVEASYKDAYWGWGPDEKGLNKLGKLWMLLRSELRSQPQEPSSDDVTPEQLAKLLESDD
jgi:predicted NAD-dependent protein-ADP-ribosyltransferase YbiA (DUF1768 family)